jgi:hypothetical protein
VPYRPRRTPLTGPDVIAPGDASYAIRVFSVRRKDRKRGPVYVVRWQVAGRGHARTFAGSMCSASSCRSTG